MQVGWVSAVQDRRIASFRYRVEAPAAGLRARGHSVELLDPARADRYDVVVFSKAYAAEHRNLARKVKKRGGRVVFDICDNHFYNPFELPKYRKARDEIAEMMSIADRVVCSTPALANVIQDETEGACAPFVIGDVVERIKPRRRQPAGADQPLRLTWFGSHGSPNAPSGMTDLLLIREELEALAAKRPVELTVCSNSREKFDRAIAAFRMETRYVEWSLEEFPDVLAQTDAAVLPMNINPFTACKTHNRLTMALYAGVPVVAAGIDSYREFRPFCTLDEWGAGLQALVEAPDEERRRALASRGHIDQRWTIETLSAQWEAALDLPSATAESRRLQKVTLQGRLDAVARTAVTGWVAAPARPNLQLQVVLECDGEPVAVALADQPRPDLAQAGLRADCGFSLPLPARAVTGAPPRLTVRVLDADWIVGENPILMAEGERPSFVPALSAAAPVASRDLRPEQRWDVAASMEAQGRGLAALEEEQAERRRARSAAAKAALGLGPRTSDTVAAGGRAKEIVWAGADRAV